MSQQLNKLRALFPEYADVPNEELIPILHKEYTPNVPIQKIYDNLGVKNPKADGEFIRGLKEQVPAIKQAGYGALSGIGALGETAFGQGGIATGIRKAGEAGYIEKQKELQETARPSDNWDYAKQKGIEGDWSHMGDFLAHSLGAGVGQLGIASVTGGAGGLLGKAVAKSAFTNMMERATVAQTEKLLAENATKLGTEKLTEEEAARLASDIVANKVEKYAGIAAIGALATGQESGEIGGEVTSEHSGEVITPKQHGLALGMGAVAGSLEGLGEVLGIKAITGGLPVGKVLSKMTGITGRVARGGVGALEAAPLEYGEEYLQTLAELKGEGKDPFTPEALNQANNAGMQGGMAGFGIGGTGGLLSKAKNVDEAIAGANADLNSPADIPIIPPTITSNKPTERRTENTGALAGVALPLAKQDFLATHVTPDGQYLREIDRNQFVDENFNPVAVKNRNNLTEINVRSSRIPETDSNNIAWQEQREREKQERLAEQNNDRATTTEANTGITTELNPIDAGTSQVNGAKNQGAVENNQSVAEPTTGELTNGRVSNEKQSSGTDVPIQQESTPRPSEQENNNNFEPTHELNDGTPVQHLDGNVYIDKGGYEWQADDAIKLPPTEKKPDLVTESAKEEIATPTKRQGYVGIKLEPGESVLTSSGRETSTFPKFKTATGNIKPVHIKAVDKWLMKNALDEAKHRGDEFNARQFEANIEKPSQADKDAAEEYLFSEQQQVSSTKTNKPYKGYSITKNNDETWKAEAVNKNGGKHTIIQPSKTLLIKSIDTFVKRYGEPQEQQEAIKQPSSTEATESVENAPETVSQSSNSQANLAALKPAQKKESHPAIESYANDLVEGGGVSLIHDEHGTITGRAPSVNPEWFKDGRFLIYKENGDVYSSTPSVREVKLAVSDYKAGKKLRPKQVAILESLHDLATEDEERGSYESDTELTHAQDMIVNHLEAEMENGKLTIDDINRVLVEFDDSIPFDVKGSDITLNELEEWLGITNEEKRPTQSVAVPEEEIPQGYTESELAKHEREQAERARKESETELKAKQKAEADKGIDSLADEMADLKDQMGQAIGELASLLGAKTNLTEEEEARLIPIMSKIFRIAAKMGYIKFKDAAQHVMSQIRQLAGDEIADKLSIENLQAGYINIAKEIGGNKAEALQYDSIEEIEKESKKEVKSIFGFDASQRFADLLLAGQSFDTIVQARKALTDQNIVAGTIEAKQADEAIELAGVLAGKQIVDKGLSESQTFDALVKLAGQMPSLNVRTSTSIEQQAYSTPLPLAYLASELAGITKKTTVTESTAGNGALLIAANPELATVNELNPDRARSLKEQGFNVTTENAVTHSFTKNGLSDVVIINPPFGAVKDDNGNTITYSIKPMYSTNEVDHAIVMNTLKGMDDDGKAVLIIGGPAGHLSQEGRSDAYNGKAKRTFFYNLYNDYNVVDHFTVSGKLYAKQGAEWPVDVIVIHGKDKSKLRLPAADVPRVINTIKELKNELPDNRPSVSKVEITIDEAQSNSTETGDAGSNFGIRQFSNRRRSENRKRVGVLFRSERSVETNGQVIESNVDESNDNTSNRPIRLTNKPNTVENKFQADYTPASTVNPVGTLVPVNMQSSIEKALQRIIDAHGDIDSYIANLLNYKKEEIGKYFSAEQVDAIALALDNIISGKGFIIGDQTGVGKGRVNAAMIRYAILNKMTPIFVTEKPNLYGDMLRDLADIGMPDVKPFATNSGENIPIDNEANAWYEESLKAKESGEKIPEKRGKFISMPSGKKQEQNMNSMIDSGKLSEGDVIFTTYNQMQTVKGEITTRTKFLKKLADGCLLILDESHNAGGTSAGPKQGKSAPEEGEKTGRAAVARELVSLAKGVFYSSATYAKRPDVLDLYSKTDMGLVADTASLQQAMVAGGVPLQQAVASMLAESGQYIRREKSFDGIVYGTSFVDVDRNFAEKVAEVMRDIMIFDDLKSIAVSTLKDEAKASASQVSADNAIGKTGIDSQNFTSIMHNMIGQMLLMLKVQPTIDEALEALKRGEKPVIALSSTMGSVIKEYADEVGLNVGDVINLNCGDLLSRYLERSRRITETDAMGNKIKRPLDDDELGKAASSFYKKIQSKINNFDFSSYKMSPIDAIHNALAKEGYKSGEITGRMNIIDYSGDVPIYKIRPAQELSTAGKRKTVNDFNNGKLDVIILNQSGATGLSLHSSPKVGGDTRKRHMIIAQPELNIDTHMQMLGRINRTGQLHLPSYSQLTANIPAEKRPSAILAKKMAMLNANTTAGKESAVKAKDVPDFMNDYGNEIAASVMTDNPELHKMLGKPLAQGNNGLYKENAMAKVTGLIPVLKLKDQEMLYQMIEDEYNDYIEILTKTGQNQLEAHAMDLDAKIVHTENIVEELGGSTSPFAAGVEAEIVDVKKLGKPYTIDQINSLLEKTDFKDDKSSYSAKESFIKTVNEEYKKALSEIEKIEEIDDKEVKRKQALKDNLEHQRNQLVQMFSNFYPSKPIVLTSPHGLKYEGIVGKFERKGQAKSFFAQGQWKMTVYVADATRQVTLPLSQLSWGATNGMSWTVNRGNLNSIKTALDEGQSTSREHRVILTGNMLAAYGFDSTGQIINYTNDKGEINQGVLMPKKFDLKQAIEKQPVIFLNLDIAMDYINNSNATNRSIRSANNDFRLMVTSTGATLYAPSSKAKGSILFGNKRVTEITGPFITRGKEMQARVSMDEIGSLLRVIYPIIGSMQPILKEEGKKFLESKGIKFSKTTTPTAPSNTHTKQSLSSAIKSIMDKTFGDGWTDRLMATGKFKVISRDEAGEIIQDLPREPGDNVVSGQFDIKYSKDGHVIAFYNPANDTTYFVHDNISQDQSSDSIKGLMLHEIGVHALQLGKSNAEFKALLTQFEQLKERNPRVKAAFNRVPADTKEEHITEEALAYFLENNPTSTLAQRIIEAFRRLVRAIGNTLIGKDKFKYSQWANKLTEQELRDMATSALKSAPESLLFDNVGREDEAIKYGFAGQNANTANHNSLAAAQQRMDAGEDKEKIREDTGWFKAVDGKWRFEINDNNARFKAGLINKDKTLNAKNMILGDVLNHPHLFDAYPELYNLPIDLNIGPSYSNAMSHYDPSEKSILIQSGTRDNALSALLHEIQHGIQHIEDFAWGSSLHKINENKKETNYEKKQRLLEEQKKYEKEMIRARDIYFDKIKQIRSTFNYKDEEYLELYEDEKYIELKEKALEDSENDGSRKWTSLQREIESIRSDSPFGNISTPPSKEEFAKLFYDYKRHAGEIEARNVEARRNFTKTERKFTSPSVTQDIADSNAIVVWNNGSKMASQQPSRLMTSVNNDIRFSLAPLEDIWSDTAALPKTTTEELKDRLRDIKDTGRINIKALGLSALTQNQLVKLGEETLPIFKNFSVERNNYDVTEANIHKQGDDIANRWQRLVPNYKPMDKVWAARNKLEMHRLADMMNSMTVLELDPRETKPEDADTAVWDELVSNYNKLLPNSKKVLDDAEKFHKDRLNDLLSSIIEKLDNSNASIEDKKRMVKELNKKFKAIKGPYSPLMRFGPYWVDHAEGFNMFETKSAQERFIKQLKDNGIDINGFGKTLTDFQKVEGIDVGFVNDINDLIDKLDVEQGDMLKDSIFQLYLTALPESSMRKRFIHRKKTPGFATDALRSFSKKAFHDGKQIAKMKYMPKMKQALKDITMAVKAGDSTKEYERIQSNIEKLRDVLTQLNNGEQLSEIEGNAGLLNQFNRYSNQNELKSAINKYIDRQKDILKNADIYINAGKDSESIADIIKALQKSYANMADGNSVHLISSIANQTAFTYILGFSPSSALINFMQTPGVALPVIAGRHGFVKSSKALADATKTFFANKDQDGFSILNGLKNDGERALYMALSSNGTFDRSRAHDLMGLSEQGVERGTLHRDFMIASSYMFHHVEMANREITALTAYRMEFEKTGDVQKSIAYADEIVKETHLDYSSANRPDLFQGNAARVMLQFKMFSQGMTWLWGKTLYDAFKSKNPERKAEARNIMLCLSGTQIAAAGVLGLPIGGILMAVQALLSLFDDDDEPKDVENEIRKSLSNTLGPDIGRIISVGALSESGADFHSRLSLSDLWVREPDKELEGKDQAYYLLKTIAGPIAGVAENVLVGMKLIGDGNTERGIEKMLPNAFSGAAKSYRLINEGGAKSLTGETIYETNAYEQALQAIGMRPSGLNEQMNQNAAIKNREQAVQHVRQRLLNHAANAKIEKNASDLKDAMESIKEFNTKYPSDKINQASILRSVKKRLSNQKSSINGININKKLKELADEESFM